MKHCDESDFWDLHYAGPCRDTEEKFQHLGDCSECAAQMALFSEQVRASALETSSLDDIPETFWTRQRLATMRQIGSRTPLRRFEPKRLAVAATLAIASFGALWTVRAPVSPVEPQQSSLQQVAQQSAAAREAVPAQPAEEADAWSAEGLSDFEELVAWEDWTPQSKEST